MIKKYNYIFYMSCQKNKKILAYRGISIDPKMFNPLHTDKEGALYAVKNQNYGYAYGFSNRELPSPEAAKILLNEGQRYYGLLIEYEVSPNSFIGKTSSLKTKLDKVRKRASPQGNIHKRTSC